MTAVAVDEKEAQKSIFLKKKTNELVSLQLFLCFIVNVFSSTARILIDFEGLLDLRSLETDKVLHIGFMILQEADGYMGLLLPFHCILRPYLIRTRVANSIQNWPFFKKMICFRRVYTINLLRN